MTIVAGLFRSINLKLSLYNTVKNIGFFTTAYLANLFRHLLLSNFNATISPGNVILSYLATRTIQSVDSRAPSNNGYYRIYERADPAGFFTAFGDSFILFRTSAIGESCF